jgi:integrase/recombinase XerC
MATELTTQGTGTVATGAPGPSALVDAFLSGRSERTLRAYRADLSDFARFAGVEDDADAAAARLMGGTHGEANAVALAYRAHLLERGLAPATVNRRLAALRSLVKLARTLGLVPWTLEVQSVPHEAYRDTRGPGHGGYLRLLDTLDAKLGAKAKRDRAAVRLLYDLALRRAEVVALDVEDFDRAGPCLWVMRKGKREKKRRTLPASTAAALVEWLDTRGTEPGPLFTNFDQAGKGSGRLSGTSLYRIVRDLGEEAGIGPVRPHGLRHAAITTALERMNGNVDAVRDFSGHADPRTVMLYNDNRTDRAGEVAALVAAP